MKRLADTQAIAEPYIVRPSTRTALLPSASIVCSNPTPYGVAVGVRAPSHRTPPPRVKRTDLPAPTITRDVVTALFVLRRDYAEWVARILNVASTEYSDRRG
jgi:hypothetical protein